MHDRSHLLFHSLLLPSSIPCNAPRERTRQQRLLHDRPLDGRGGACRQRRRRRVHSRVAVAPVAPNIYAVTVTNRLLHFNSVAPGVLLGSVQITGLVGGDNVLGMDFRPATGQFYAVSNGSRYTIHRATGAATRLGADGAFTLTGTSFGVDFNPVPTVCASSPTPTSAATTSGSRNSTSSTATSCRTRWSEPSSPPSNTAGASGNNSRQQAVGSQRRKSGEAWEVKSQASPPLLLMKERLEE